MQTLLDVKDEQIADFKKELARKDEAIKEEVLRREREMAAKEAEIKFDAERREQELKAKERQVGAVIVCNDSLKSLNGL